MTHQVNVYPKNTATPTVTNSDPSKANLAVCFSGGGSRALTCAWGQLLGLKTLGLTDKFRYISSVSGGTWASSIYTFLPEHISDEDLLGQYHPPQNLSLSDENGTFNINNLEKYSLGQAPAGLGTAKITEEAVEFLICNRKENHKWLWAHIVGEKILEPFDLRAEGSESWNSSKSYTLSASYARDVFPNDAPPPTSENFFFVRPGRPFIVMNDNIMEKVQITGKTTWNIVQLPNQATPVSTGAFGETPDKTVIGNGSVESYGYNSTLDQTSAEYSPVSITIDQPYSLIDSVSTSSAFFAEALADYIKIVARETDTRHSLANNVEQRLNPNKKKNLIEKFKDKVEDLKENIEQHLLESVVNDSNFMDSIIPRYNYWSIGSDVVNTETLYTDGGTLDNSGVIGILSQTDTGKDIQEPINLVVFDNTSTPLEKINGKIIAGSQAAPLFGIEFSVKTGEHQPFNDSQKDPSSPEFKEKSLIQVFDNNITPSGKRPFEQLIEDLFSSNSGENHQPTPTTSQENTSPAYHQSTLYTVENTLGNIRSGRKVNILYIQNAKMLHWQNALADEKLKNEIVEAQKDTGDKLEAFSDFENFPYYNTFFKIGLKPKESNALSQMWAWATCSDESPLTQIIKGFVLDKK